MKFLKKQTSHSRISRILIIWFSAWTAVVFGYVNWFPYPIELSFWDAWLHIALFSCWFLALLCSLRLVQTPTIARFLTEKWSFPIIFLAFSLLWLIPVCATWIGRANWGMVVSTELIKVFIASMREMSQMAAFNATPIVVLLITGLALFLNFQHKRAFKTSQTLHLFFKKAGRPKLVFCCFFAISMLVLPILWPKSRKEAITVIAGKNPFSSFFYANFREKYLQAKQSKAFQQPISDPNVPKLLADTFQKKNIIIICLDALRADRLAAYGGQKGQMPQLDSLIEHGFFQKIEHGISNGTSTIEGIYSMIYSNKFESSATPTDRPGLPWLLKQAGFETHFLLAGIHRAWYGLGNFYTANATTFFEGMDSGHYGLNDDRILLEGLDKLPDFSGNPAFFYVHSMSSHLAGTKLPQFQRHKPDSYDFWAVHTQQQIDAYSNHYQNGVEQADWMLINLLEKFQQKGYLQNSILWVVADHGENLGEHGGVLAHGDKLWAEIMRIPILFHDSDSTKLANLQLATLTDLAPTTAARIGLPVPKKWIGVSLTRPLEARQIRLVGKDCEGWVRMRTGSFEKFWVNQSDSVSYFFDLNSDPREENNLFPGKKPSNWPQ